MDSDISKEYFVKFFRKDTHRINFGFYLATYILYFTHKVRKIEFELHIIRQKWLVTMLKLFVIVNHLHIDSNLLSCIFKINFKGAKS